MKVIKSPLIRRIWTLTLFSLFFAVTKQVQALTNEQVISLLDSTFNTMQNHYIEPHRVSDIKDIVMSRHALGRYSALNSLDEFAAIVGKDIRDISADKHLSLFTIAENQVASHILPHPAGKLSDNFSFEQVSYLHGNIGYLKFNKFHPDEAARETLDAAFAFLKPSQGMIIDLRDTIGGSPMLAKYMLSYFISNHTPLWHVLDKKGGVIDRIRVDEEVKHTDFRKNYPVWLLTSNRSASATELFAGTMQANGKATLIGEVTSGAGFYVGVKNITPQLVFRISLSKPIISATNVNWEKTGLQPDFKVESIDALAHAHQSALQYFASSQ